MHAIIVYDIGVERVNKVRKILKEYLVWTQNSVFRGDITESRLIALERRLKEAINEKYDSIIIFTIRDKSLVKEKLLGTPRAISPDELEIL